jgi:8-oxo-dGTP pyrophosphatase MutT (NUDIX family)
MPDKKASSTDQPVDPVDAATVLLIRDSAYGIEVFMVVRHRNIEFAGGALVFPGGKVDPEDSDQSLEGRRGMKGTLPSRLMALRVAAIRETFEEASVLLARVRGSDTLIGPGLQDRIVEQYRDPLYAGDVTMADIVTAENLELACDLLVPFSHWITPITQPKRFDTHFFLAPVPAQMTALHDGTESVESIWVRPAVAIADAEAGQRSVMFPTRMNLNVLGRSDKTADAVQAARETPVVPVMPTAEKVEGGRIMHIPAEAGYGVSKVFVDYAGAMPPR